MSTRYLKIGLSDGDKVNMKTEIRDSVIEDLSPIIDTRLDNQDTKIENIVSGSPKGVYASLSALQSAYPSGSNGVYLCSDNGHWYYWNGSAWTDGGLYQATSIASGDISRVELNEDLKKKTDNSIKAVKAYDGFKVGGNLIPYGVLEVFEDKYNYKSATTGKIIFDNNPAYTSYKLDYIPNNTYYISDARYFDVVDIDGNVIEEYEDISKYTSKSLANAKYIYICIHDELGHYISIGEAKKMQNNFISSIFTNNDVNKKMYSKVNIYPNNVLEVIEGKYAYKDAVTGKINFSNSSSYKVCKVPFLNNIYYSCPLSMRFFEVVDDNDNVLFELEDISSGDVNSKDAYAYVNAKYIYITINSDVGVLYKNSVNILKDLGTSAKDISISASCKIGTPGLKLCLYTDDSELKNYIEITSSEIIAWSYLFGTPYERRTNHNLTLENNIQVNAFIKNGNYCNITLISNGEKFEWSANFDKMDVTHLEVETASNNTDITYSYNVTDLDKDNWIFGDSYVSIGDSARWISYLKENTNYNNYLIDGHSGENSSSSLVSLKNLLKIGKPKNVFWFLGMNDGNDTSINTPSTGWLNGYNEVIRLSKEYGFNLIFGTIPTVPTVNNEAKNNTIRSSNYEYVDFAKSVGASSSGVWYDGMLSSDGVHPSEKGAKALYGQFIVDAIQIKIKK